MPTFVIVGKLATVTAGVPLMSTLHGPLCCALTVGVPVTLTFQLLPPAGETMPGTGSVAVLMTFTSCVWVVGALPFVPLALWPACGNAMVAIVTRIKIPSSAVSDRLNSYMML